MAIMPDVKVLKKLDDVFERISSAGIGAADARALLHTVASFAVIMKTEAKTDNRMRIAQCVNTLCSDRPYIIAVLPRITLV